VGVRVIPVLPLGAVDTTVLVVWLTNEGEERLEDVQETVVLQLLSPTGILQLGADIEPERTFRYTVCDATRPSWDTQLKVQFWLE
jgi:hypothetical protein